MESPATELAITVQLSKSLLLRAIFRKQIRSLSYWIVPVVVICGTLTGLRGNPFAAITAAFVACAMLIIVPLSASRAAAKNPGVLAPITYVFDDLGVSAKFINGEVRSEWSLVVGAFETAKDVFVVMQRGSFHLLPKAQVNERELTLLRQILHCNLGSKASRVRPA